MPLRNTAGRIVAVLQGLNRIGESGFTQSDLQIISSIVDCLGSVLHRLQLAHHTAVAKKRAEELMAVMRELHTENDSVAVIERIIVSAYRLLSAQRVTLLLVDAQRQVCATNLLTRARYSLEYVTQRLIISSSQDAEGASMPLDQGIAGYVATTGNSVNIPGMHSALLLW